MKKPLKPKGIAADFTETGLPTRDQVNQVLKEVLPPDGKTRANNFGRVKFTTMINPDFRERLQTMAKHRKTTVSQLLEEAILKFLDGM